jgi:Holliday junction resolvase RusA-like endonuclease
MVEPDTQLPLIAEAAPLIVAAEPFCVFELPGRPHAWERPGATIRFGNGRPFIHWYVPAEEAQYREQIAWCARAAMRSKEPTPGPVALIIHAFMPIPSSWTMRKQLDAANGALLPATRPDWDNFGKLVDALKSIVWTDDATVVDGRVIKRYSRKPALRFEIREYVSG